MSRPKKTHKVYSFPVTTVTRPNISVHDADNKTKELNFKICYTFSLTLLDEIKNFCVSLCGMNNEQVLIYYWPESIEWECRLDAREWK